MALDPSNSLTYGELISTFKNWVKTNCNNIDAYSSSVPSSLKAGFSKKYTYNSNKYLTLSINSWDVISVVASSTVETDINNFLTDRNIIARANDCVTTSGLLNFMHNMIIFCNAKVLLVASQFSSTPILMYNPNTIQAYESLDNLTDMNTTPSEEPVSAADFIKIAKGFDSSLTNSIKYKFIVYKATLS